MNNENLQKEFNEVKIRLRYRLKIIAVLIVSIIILNMFLSFIEHRVSNLTSNVDEGGFDDELMVDDTEIIKDNKTEDIFNLSNIIINQSNYNYISKGFDKNDFIELVDNNIYYIESSPNLDKVIEYNILDNTKSIIYKDKNLDLLSGDGENFISFITIDKVSNKNYFNIMNASTRKIKKLLLEESGNVLSYAMVNNTLYYTLQGQSKVYSIDMTTNDFYNFYTPINTTAINVEGIDSDNLYVYGNNEYYKYNISTDRLLNQNKDHLSYNINNNQIDIYVEDTIVKDPKSLIIINEDVVFDDYAYHIKLNNNKLYILNSNNLFVYNLMDGSHIKTYNINLNEMFSNKYVYKDGYLFIVNNDNNINFIK